MDEPSKSRKGQYLFLFLLFVCSSALLLTHLTHSFLWNDEGSTVLLARTILSHGVPMGRDGENSVSAEEGRDITPGGIYKFQPWLQYYVTAASFALFGESTFTARLPFALFGIATILLTYFLAWEIWKSRAAAMASSLILMLSVPFLLLAGQCRYYTLSAFFTTLALWSYLRILERRKGAPAVLAFAGLALLHTNHGHGLVVLAAVAIHAVLWHRGRARTVLCVIGAIILINLPWLAWMSTSHYNNAFSFQKTFMTVRGFVLELLLFAPHPIFCIAALVLAVAHSKKVARVFSRLGQPANRVRFDLADSVCRLSQPAENPRYLPDSATDGVSLALTLTVVAIPLMSFFVDRPYFRYLVLLLPLASVMAGKIVTASWQLNRTWTCVVVFLWLLTGLLPLYFYELTQDYKGPVGGIVTYLNEHAHPGDLVAISYEDLPLKFYTKLRVIGGYAGDDLSQAKQAKWVIPRKYGNGPVRDYLLHEVPLNHYRKIVLEGCPDICYENRESPFEHSFTTVTDEGPVVIYERVEP